MIPNKNNYENNSLIFVCLFVFCILDQCEQWLPGVYNVTMLICNGQCGSHHPHTQIYDTARGSFEIHE